VCKVPQIFKDGRGVLQLQKLLLFVLEESEGEAKYDLWRKMNKAVVSGTVFISSRGMSEHAAQSSPNSQVVRQKQNS